jgi:hypothetical protein
LVNGTDPVQTLEIAGHMGQDRQNSSNDIVTEDTNSADHATEKRVRESRETGLKQDSDMVGPVDTNTSAIVTRTPGMTEGSSQTGKDAEEPRGGEEGFFLDHSQPPTDPRMQRMMIRGLCGSKVLRRNVPVCR